MFFGEYSYRVDEKGRVPIPPRFREAFQDGIVLSPGPEKCIIARTPAEWKKLADGLAADSLPASKMRKLYRAIFSTAFSTRLDAQGRVAVPPPLRAHADLTGDVVVAGANNTLEVWNKEHWEEEKAVSQDQAWQIIESLEKR